ncbi:conserved hypothetical protein [Weissella viridescens]|jgi:hypothetical protein|uniref:DUF2969 domain-containing protein n=1 Tax=Weissella viridescens TaxID=1629 RepID=A0A0R2GZL5_WEIVI|nr:DUF2969 family protein [Weissella viridescens]KRN45896.1 hypothetical protein IV50_GL001239 [Weissella viridescens]MBX4173241.1 DUF2969 domain-containing protein [Weissella viridescens]MCB6840108.1 DUF2969 domain-containing protein [Weissella viridescens]MCB6846840.1 DUF2969 domain-containing protein [Weissella viridescens]QOD85896.1 DUF2969 family protein [Weissella viridescens]
MPRKNKPVAVEISDAIDGQSEVKINKVVLGQIKESDDTITVIYPDNHTVKAPDFDAGVSMLIAEYNLHH